MALVTWQDSYSVKVFQFDAQHKRLFDLINQLHDAMSKGQGNDVLGKILRELVSYTKTHFAAEEQLLQSKKYPGYLSQKTAHDKFVAQLATFQQEFSEGKSAVSAKILTFLRDWLINHIASADKQYGDFLNKSN